MHTIVINTVVDEILSLYQQFGNSDYIGEPVSQIEHMCQCAALAEQNGYDAEVILAAFFHDIGHLCEQDKDAVHMGSYGLVDHEKLGAEYLLKRGFSKKIAALVESHVAAKRYLTYVFPEYYEKLSVASKITLIHQGGKMTETEARLFELDPLFHIYIALRKWDEEAKLENIPLPSLDRYREMMILHLKGHQ